MNEKLLPEHVDPFRYADQSIKLDGLVKISDMPRLQSMVMPTENKAEVHLHFGVDEQKIVFLRGDLKASVNLQCQRCMEPFIHEIISHFDLGVAKSLEEADKIPHHYEPALVNKDNYLALRELIEDELILNIPIIPKHAQEACKINLPLQDPKWQAGEKLNPFQVLETLKDKKPK